MPGASALIVLKCWLVRSDNVINTIDAAYFARLMQDAKLL